MKKFRIIGAAALSLLLAGPVMAAAGDGSGNHRVHQKPHGRMIYATHAQRMPAQSTSAQDFDHFDLGIARPTYHSGWGDPYRDGEYPGSVDQNMGPTGR
jgi:hypothetical protein